MPTISRLKEVGDLLATSIDRHLKKDSPLARCERKWMLNIRRDTLQTWKTANSRTFRAFVLPDNIDSEIETRGSDIAIYRFIVVFIEPYVGQDEVDEDWVDARIERCADVVNTFGELREPLDGADLRAEVGRFTSIIERDILLENGLFWSEAEFEYRESVYA